MPAVNVLNSDCGALEAGETLYITYDEVSGHCAGPVLSSTSPCSFFVTQHLDATELVVALDACEPPEQGEFVATELSCDGSPMWRWTETVQPGREHRIGIDGHPYLGSALVGELATTPGECPAPSVVQVLPPTQSEPVLPQAIHWANLPTEHFSIAPRDGGFVVEWSAVELGHWVLGDSSMVLRSETMTEHAAEEVLQGAERQGPNLRVGLTVVGGSRFFEGTRTRAIVRCEQVLTHDYTMELHPTGVLLSGHALERRAIDASHCTPENAQP
jgi:hypothetical protein